VNATEAAALAASIVFIEHSPGLRASSNKESPKMESEFLTDLQQARLTVGRWLRDDIRPTKNDLFALAHQLMALEERAAKLAKN
jgi:hypothetical protein